ncbi:MAG: FtsQ-type POTRA domain-containing protein [Candidatus Paceibacterota bacterium]|jgi:cell division septal protein FtsQ
MIKRKRKKVIRRKKKGGFFLSFSIFFLIIASSAIGFLFFSPRFQIEDLVIVGNMSIPTEEIETIAGEKIKTSFSLMGIDFVTESIFLSLGNKIEQIKEAMPGIETISIKRNYPSGISLEIVEKTPYAVWSYEDEKYLVDKKGSFIKNTEESGDYDDLIKIDQQEDIDDLDKKSVITSIFLINTELNNQDINILEYNLFNDKLKSLTDKNFFIIFDLKQDISWQVEKLKIVLEKNTQLKDSGNIEYIDLRFDNQTVVKNK